MLHKYFLLWVLLFSSTTKLLAQTTAQRGRVVDAETGQALTTVRISQGQAITQTNAQGYFSLPSPTPDDSIKIYLSGYHTANTLPKPGQMLYLRLQPLNQDLAEVLVADHYAPQKYREHVGSLAILDQRALQRDVQTHISPALNRVPGVYAHQGAFNTSRITIRGTGSRSLFSTNKIRSYLNEIPLTGGDGESILDDLDLSVLGRVAILKGPGSCLYGGGLGGVIRLHTQAPEYKTSSITQDNTWGSFGLWRNSTRLQYGSERFYLQAAYTRTQGEGFRENSQHRRESFNLWGEWYATETLSFYWLSSYTDLLAFIPSSIDERTFRNNPRAAAANWLAARGYEAYGRHTHGLGMQLRLSPRWELHSTAFGGGRIADEPRPFDILAENSRHLGIRSTITYSAKLKSSNLRWIIGQELFGEWYDAQTYTNTQGLRGAIRTNFAEQRQYGNVFSQLELPLAQRWHLSSGLLLHQTRYTLQDQLTQQDFDGVYTYAPILAPRLGFRYQPSETQSFYLSIGRGFSTPSVDETLTPEGLPNPNIRPETGWNYELGVRVYFWQKRLFADATLYYMQIQDLLVARRTAEDTFVGLNAGGSLHPGAETQLTFSPWPQRAQQLQFFANYSWMPHRFGDFVDGEQDFSGNILTGVPLHTANVGLDWHSPKGWFGTLNFQWIGRQALRDDNKLFYNGHRVWNLRTGYERNIINQRIHLQAFVGIQNILDEAYAAMVLINAPSFGNVPPRYYYPGTPRNYFAGYSLRWQL